ncbi:hypothetical protein TRAPUB_11155 [Trametes pubescens]|uniref:Uncharacterized protein n=1 Tax=Trametes pubescens TaxID=154538 RepID=A0A1M2VXH9_TRAPU|nr:hypothetical protein TRAPUB_11155 [Trametes pubescens]
MQRRTSQTFQRLRKLSDSLISAIVPHPSNKSTESFFDYDKKGWTASFSSGSAHAHAHAHAHAPAPAPAPTHVPIHRRPSFRNGQRVYKEDIRYPLLKISQEQLRHEPSTDALSARARAKRPERPREEDLPFGASGGIPKALAPPYVAPPPAVGARPRPHSSRAGHNEARSSVPFPHPGSGARERDRERAAEVGRAQREKPLPEPPREERAGGRRQQPHSPRPAPAPAPDAFYKLFGSAPGPASKPAPRAPAVAREVYDPFIQRRAEQPHPYAQPQPQPSSHQSYARVRRISSTGDVHPPPPPHHTRPRDENARPRNHDRDREQRHPDLRPSRSTPLRLHENRGRSPEPPPQVPMYPYPVSPQRPLMHVTKPRPRNVPRDVSPEHNPQQLPTPRRSREELRAYYEAQHQQGARSVAAQLQAGLRVQQSAAPHRPVRVDATLEHARPMAAQMVRPGRDAEREQERERRAQREREREARHLARAQDKERRGGRERERVLRPTHTRAVEVEYYGMADAFSQEIAIALADPERAHPLPADWRVAPGSGGEYGPTVRPLVTKKKSRHMAGAM